MSEKKPASKHLRFEFYRVELPTEVPRFEMLLSKAQQITELEKRLVLKSEVPVRWEFLDELPGSGVWTGDITRMREDVVPNKAARGRPRERLKLADDESTTEDTVFAYDAQLRVLVCHNNRFGVSAYDIVTYFAQLNGLTSAAEVNVVLTPEGYATIEQFSYFDKVAIKIARPAKGPMPKSGNISVDSAINAATEVNAKYMELGFSVGRAKIKMESSPIAAMVGAVAGMARDYKSRPVRRLVVTGMRKDGDSGELDLLHNRLETKQAVTVTKDRDLPYAERRVAVQKALESSRDVLTRLFSPTEQ